MRDNNLAHSRVVRNASMDTLVRRLLAELDVPIERRSPADLEWIQELGREIRRRNAPTGDYCPVCKHGAVGHCDERCEHRPTLVTDVALVDGAIDLRPGKRHLRALDQ